MGTHPIFESDFDCLTDVQVGLKSKKMSTHLQWAIINKFSAFDLKRAGTTWTKEPGHLKGNARKTFKSIRNTTNKGKLRKDQKRAAVKKACRPPPRPTKGLQISHEGNKKPLCSHF